MSAFARTFMRSSRAALRVRSGVNPLQSTLGLNGSSQFVRNYAAAFERNKPHVNIGAFPDQWFDALLVLMIS